jgi:hypothetical protein
MLQTLADSGELAAVNNTAFALTPALRESYTAGDTEELEYAALLDAARASLRLLATDSAAPRRRAVVAADVEDATVRPDLDHAVVRLAGPVPSKLIASVHVDTEEAQDAVAAASEVVDAADLGDEDAEFTVGDAQDHELAWYAVQELPFFLELFPG